jgi:two-component system cell cycle response regulator DivK
LKQTVALIIEDDERLAMIYAEALRSAGFEPEIIQDGRTAQTRLQEIIPTLILLDLHLPHISGDELLRQIRADARLQNSVVMLATADAIMAEGLRVDSDLVLLKPISFIQLRDLAARLHPLT